MVTSRCSLILGLALVGLACGCSSGQGAGGPSPSPAQQPPAVTTNPAPRVSEPPRVDRSSVNVRAERVRIIEQPAKPVDPHAPPAGAVPGFPTLPPVSGEVPTPRVPPQPKAPAKKVDDSSGLGPPPGG